MHSLLPHRDHAAMQRTVGLRRPGEQVQERPHRIAVADEWRLPTPLKAKRHALQHNTAIGRERAGGRGGPVERLAAQLARRLGLHIMTGVCRPLADGRYEVRIFEALQPDPKGDVRELTQRVWDHFEKTIRQYPECWMWMYKHWRYLPAKSHDADVASNYPSYSNPSPAFAEMATSKM